METSFRYQFLHQHWLRYPPMPCSPAPSLWGRLQRSPTQGWQLSRDGEQQSLPLEDCYWWEAQTDGQRLLPSPSQVLDEGDWVAVRVEEGQWSIILLAPKQEAQVACGWQYSTGQLWQRFMHAVRNYFAEHSFCEVPTPTLASSPGCEPFLEPFVTELRWGGKTQPAYLPFSPEFSLKKMLSLGWTRIFEIRPCFRNNEWSATHQPEFLMVEWYRAGANLEAIRRDCENLLACTSQALEKTPPKSVQIKTVAELFYDAFEFTLTPQTSRQQLAALAAKEQVEVSADDSWDDLFFRLFLTRIELSLGDPDPLLVCHYPPSQAALARLTPEGWADRFELYWRGLELGNAFHELNDPDEQHRRLQADLDERRRVGGREIALDPEFLQALRSGLPPSAGIALGLERLFMALTGISNLDRVRPFAWRGFTDSYLPESGR